MDFMRALRRKAEQVEVMEVSSETTTVQFEANRLKSSQAEEASGIAARVVKEGRLGFSASSDLLGGERLVRNVLQSADVGEAVALEFPHGAGTPDVKAYDKAIAEMTLMRMVSIGEEVVDHILSEADDVQVNVEVTRGVRQMQIRNHTGLEQSFVRSPFTLMVEVRRIRGDDVLIAYDVVGRTVWDGDYLGPARRLSHQLGLAQRQASIASGRMPVLFSPAGSLVLYAPLLQGLDGQNVLQGVSPMGSRLGERIFDRKITMVDDGTLPGGFASAPCDDEGVVHRRHALVDQGVVNGFVYDLKTAAQSGVSSTGNGTRDLFSPPSPGMSNLLVEGGQRRTCWPV